MGSLLPDGHLSVAPDIVRELGLQPHDSVQVALISLPGADAKRVRRDAKRADIWRQVDALREGFSDREFSLTDALLQTREEEDAAL